MDKNTNKDDLIRLFCELVENMTDDELYDYYSNIAHETDQYFRDKDYKSMREVLTDYYILWDAEEEDLIDMVNDLTSKGKQTNEQ